MSIFDLYGIREADIDRGKSYLEPYFSERFEAHDSSYIGEYWLLRSPNGEVTLQPNLTPDGEWMEVEYKDFPNLLYVSDVLDQDGLKQRLEKGRGIIHLRREVL